MSQRRILWADDQIDELRGQIIFLEGKGYEVVGVSNGDDALDLLARESFEAVLLDEMMPGRGGMETLQGIRDLGTEVPVIMITKSEEEELMNRALGRRISDYLVKPVNPMQIFMALKRALDQTQITEQETARNYLSGFGQMSQERMMATNFDEWARYYDRLVDWDLQLNKLADPEPARLNLDQIRDSNSDWARFVEREYLGWLDDAKGPVMSHRVLDHAVLEHLRAGTRVVFFLIDCMRLDQWRVIESVLSPLFTQRREVACAMLPTATPFARNAIFSGLLPREIKARYPQWWRGSAREERSKNAFEKELLGKWLEDRGLGKKKYHYAKTFDMQDLETLRKKVPTLKDSSLIACVVNFLDILSHGRSDNELLKEIAPDEVAFRSVMRSWFEHSALFEMFRDISGWEDTVVVVTSDHGSIQVRKPTVVKANRDASSNVRYKYGDNINGEAGAIMDLRDPEKWGLPRDTAIQNYVIACESNFFVYPTNQHEYERQFRDSFQHGGVSLEEMIVPLVTLTAR
ncbi:PglZ domain-containing protein [bacterium]|nr:MAG: PglZ domain-containing protein [bacterium]